MTIQQAFDIAVQHFQSGRFRESESLFRQIVQSQPDYADGLHMFGLALMQLGRAPEAFEPVQRAIKLKPTGQTWCLLGQILMALGRLDEAIDACKRSISLMPGLIDAHSSLGNALNSAGRHAEAIAVFREALRHWPKSEELHFNLGNALSAAEQNAEAAEEFRRAVSINHGMPGAWNNLGATLFILGRMDEATDALRTALKLNPNLSEAHYAMGTVLWRQGKLVDAIPAWQKALQIRPDFPEALNNLGNAMKHIGQLDRATELIQGALRLRPDSIEALINDGGVLKDQGRIPEAEAIYRKVLSLKPANQIAWSNLLYGMHFNPATDGRAIAIEHERWDREMAAPLRASVPPHENDRDPDRRLKIGYVSPDFYTQAECFFVLPLLKNHDRAQVEVHCYASVKRPDSMTQRIKSSADVWHDVLARSNDELARQIREDRIDVLVDLTMHMNDNRILTFARKPAPVQVAWLAYPGTTGLKAIDYRITDRHMDSENSDQSFSAEEALRLPDCWCAYDPLENELPIQPSAAARNGFITFGSMNNFCKMNPAVLALWARVLLAVPRSKLLLGCPAGKTREPVVQMFASQGISAEHIEFVGTISRPDYLRGYGRVDIGLDPFPYGGITTTCDSLWMGVPVLTLANKAPGLPQTRAGVSLLSTAGLPQFIATSEDHFVELATAHASDLTALSSLRAGLREQVKSSPLMDAPRFARNMEAAYRSMWRRYCSASGAGR